MRAALHDRSVAHHENQVGAADRGKAVRDEEGGAVAQKQLRRLLDQLLGLGVDGAGGLVEHKDARVSQHGAGKGNQLLFAGRQAVAALAHVALIAVFQLRRHLVGGDGLRRRDNLLVRRVKTAIADVLHHGAGKQVRALQHITDAAVQPQLAALAVILAVDQHLSGRRLKEPAREIHQRAFSSPRLAHDGNRGPGGDFQVKVTQHVLVAVRIAEGNVAEFDLAADRLPVLALGLKGRAVALDHLGRVRDQRLLVKQSHDALDVRLERQNIRDIPRDLLDRLEDAHRVGRERRERADQQKIGEHQRAAARENDRRGQRAEEHDKRDIHGGEPRRLHGGHAHILRHGLKLAAVLILDDERFRRARAHDPLVVRAGDPRIHLAHAAVPAQDSILKPAGQKRNHRHNEDDRRGQAGIEEEHCDKHAEHIEDCPQDIHHIPRDHARDTVGVAHDPGEQIAHRGHVVIRERERLQMHKAGALHVAPQAHFNAHGAACEQDDGQRLQHNHGGIRHREPRQAGVVPRLDEFIDRVPLEQRQSNVDAGAHKVQRQHR